MTTAPDDRSHKATAARAMILMGAAYPVLAHTAALTARPGLVAASIGLLVVLVLFPGLRNGRPLAWAMLLAAGLGLQVAVASGKVLLLLFLPPILLNGFMAWVFGHTLRRGRTPLIERVARAMRGPEDPPGEDIVAYARRVTEVWAGLFVVLTAVNLVLATYARPGGLLLAAGLDPGVTVPLSTWSLFANVLNYLVVGALFLAEYVVRQHRFPRQPYQGLFDFMRRLSALGGMFRPVGRDGGSS